ncbi:putative thaumatin family protein [Phaeoacremonium minimum UCRPA7]|uniref:Putative thaumatin family protein n=1 Tax=Phaeoacremonium minimum (strain UCR-PA7) TaxID=1286976 RepID=R8B9G1_PHAM7|nr:putative thaumatin family protein [Phaeoacremonium minimum UCRPA7]EON95928.1 putative thaumatin family protein [Phaeoacremonium minimum UCRPA7]
MEVSSNWQGRVWGRTNCTFTENGTAPADMGGVACTTGDCFGKLDCAFSGAPPSTLAEFTLAGGSTGKQTFYDISLVDGYNIPVGIVYLPAPNTSFIPPNLVNTVCIATAGYLDEPAARTGDVYTNASFPMPYESSRTNANIAKWCPWDLQTQPPSKPGDGVYPYPDDGIARPVFDPCLSACAHSGADKDCCTGKYNNPKKCKRGLYSTRAKQVCPDAYSFAYDDQASTFIIPSGGGWEVVFCPAGRSTDILATFGTQLSELASTGNLTSQSLADVKNITYIESQDSAGTSVRPLSTKTVLAVVLGVATAFTLW